MRVFRILLLAVLLSGCTTLHYQYMAPEDPKGHQCILECEKIKATCELQNDTHYSDCLQEREEEEREYRRCQRGRHKCIKPKNICKNSEASDYKECIREYKKSLQTYRACQDNNSCDYPRSCYRSDVAGCLTSYHRCFELCGGTIIITEY